MPLLGTRGIAAAPGFGLEYKAPVYYITKLSATSFAASGLQVDGAGNNYNMGYSVSGVSKPVFIKFDPSGTTLFTNIYTSGSLSYSPNNQAYDVTNNAFWILSGGVGVSFSSTGTVRYTLGDIYTNNIPSRVGFAIYGTTVVSGAPIYVGTYDQDLGCCVTATRPIVAKLSSAGIITNSYYFASLQGQFYTATYQPGQTTFYAGGALTGFCSIYGPGIMSMNTSDLNIVNKYAYLRTGGFSGAYIFDMVTDSSNNVYFPTYDTGAGGIPVVKMTSTAASITWQIKINSPSAGTAYGYSIAIDSAGNLYVTGQTSRTSPSSTQGVLVAKLNSSGVLQWARTVFTTSENIYTLSQNSIKINSNGQIVLLIRGGNSQYTLQLPSDGSKTGNYTLSGSSIVVEYAVVSVTTTTITAGVLQGVPAAGAGTFTSTNGGGAYSPSTLTMTSNVAIL